MDSSMDIVDVSRQKRKRKTDASTYSTDEDSFLLSDDAVFSDDIASGAPAAKYREVETIKGAPGLDKLCCELLFEIFQYVDSWTLMALMNTCTRFHSFVQDHRFWQNIDLSKEPLPMGILEDVVYRTDSHTSCIKIRGPPTSHHVEGEFRQFSRSLASTFTTRCVNLTVLEFQCVALDFGLVNISKFPKTLRRLIFNDCSMRFTQTDPKQIFTGLDGYMPDLKEIGIEYSDWFDPYYLVAFSKVRCLRWLSLQGCQHLQDFIPYGSMAARCGFKALEYLDLRFTPVTDSDLQCFNFVATLKELLLDCPPAAQKKCADAAKVIESIDSEQPSTSVDATKKLLGISEDDDRPSTSRFARLRREQELLTRREMLRRQLGDLHNFDDSSTSSSSSSSSTSTCSSSTSDSSTSTNNSPTLSPEQPQQAAEEEQQPPPMSLAHRIDQRNAMRNPFSPSSWRFHLSCLGRWAPRPDQIIYLDLTSRSARAANAVINPILHVPAANGNHEPNGEPNANPNPNVNANRFRDVLEHPFFFDMVNPLNALTNRAAGAAAAQQAAAAAAQVHQAAFNYNNEHADQNDLITAERFVRNTITDRGLCCFGRPTNPVELGVIVIRIGNRPAENSFERLSVRNYRLVTDTTLQHMVQVSPRLVYLDLSGTGVTRDGVLAFKRRKPNCVVVADHLDLSPDSGLDENGNE